MSLTKKDLKSIRTIVNDSVNRNFEMYVDPLHKWSIEMNNWRKEVDGKLDELGVIKNELTQLNGRMDDLVQDTHKTLIKQDELLIKYWNDFVTQQTFGKLEKRVHKLELATA